MADEQSVAIIGMAGRFPGADDVDEYWDRIVRGEECITFFPADDLDPAARPLAGRPELVLAGGVLSGVDLFDAGLFRMSPEEAALTDPQHRSFLECAWTALEDAGYGEVATFPGVAGVYAGTSLSSYAAHAAGHVRTAHDELQALVASGVDYLPALAAYKLNLRGESLAVQAACATALVAVHLACQSLLTGQTDLALAGAASIDPRQHLGHLHEPGGTLSPDGHCRPFSAEAQGTVRGFGAGVVVLRRLTDALADGDPIHAIIRATAVTNDGRDRVGFAAPSVSGQAQAVANALAMAEADAESIGYVEAHGTATPLGDAMEVEALARGFNSQARGTCLLGSVKANIGHLGETSGMASLVKAVLAIERRTRPGLFNFSTPNPLIDFGRTPFAIERSAAEWPSTGPRRAGVNNYAVGGTNVHVVLEEAPGRAPSAPRRGPWLFGLSARSAAGLSAVHRDLGDWLRSHADAALEDVAYTLAVGRRAFPCRRAIIADSDDTLGRALGDADGEPLAISSAAPVPLPLRRAAERWLDGEPLDAETLFESRRRVRLPTRPLERRRYWLDPEPASGVHPVAWWLEVRR